MSEYSIYKSSFHKVSISTASGTGQRNRASRILGAMSGVLYSRKRKAFVCSVTRALRFKELHGEGYDVNPTTGTIEPADKEEE
ncbi:MAG: hypothetical protein V3T23_12430 [Nitrososphaerales archaeon]